MRVPSGKVPLLFWLGDEMRPADCIGLRVLTFTCPLWNGVFVTTY